jgi:hypothetical protein
MLMLKSKPKWNNIRQSDWGDWLSQSDKLLQYFHRSNHPKLA